MLYHNNLYYTIYLLIKLSQGLIWKIYSPKMNLVDSGDSANSIWVKIQHIQSDSASKENDEKVAERGESGLWLDLNFIEMFDGIF